jgi:hypothetical protein
MVSGSVAGKLVIISRFQNFTELQFLFLDVIGFIAEMPLAFASGTSDTAAISAHSFFPLALPLLLSMV